MNKRVINIDILRIIAFCLVVSVHFFLYNDFYNTLNTGFIMYINNILRCLFMCCVPLFIIITGYLMNKKELSIEYFKKISKTILTYVICSIICIVAITMILNKDILTIKEYIFQILNYSGAPYAWYINMYIGLYMFIPFLNILWNNLKDQKSKKLLIIVLFCFITLPTFLNTYNFIDKGWFLSPNISRQYQMIFPNYWSTIIYPILYYFTGAYLKEFPIKINKYLNILIIVVLLVIFGSYNFFRNYNCLFDYGIYTDFSSFEVFMITVLLSNFIINLKLNFNDKLNKVIKKISELTLGAYLLSAIYDIWIYNIFSSYQIHINEKIYYMFPLIFIIILLSLISSYFEIWIEKIIKLIYKKILKN